MEKMEINFSMFPSALKMVHDTPCDVVLASNFLEIEIRHHLKVNALASEY
jgi:hypothetical protein